MLWIVRVDLPQLEREERIAGMRFSELYCSEQDQHTIMAAIDELALCCFIFSEN